MVGVAYIPRKPLAKMARPQTRTSKEKSLNSTSNFQLQALPRKVSSMERYLAIVVGLPLRRSRRLTIPAKESAMVLKTLDLVAGSLIPWLCMLSRIIRIVRWISACQSSADSAAFSSPLKSSTVVVNSPARVERSRLGFSSSSSSSVSLSPAFSWVCIVPNHSIATALLSHNTQVLR